MVRYSYTYSDTGPKFCRTRKREIAISIAARRGKGTHKRAEREHATYPHLTAARSCRADSGTFVPPSQGVLATAFARSGMKRLTLHDLRQTVVAKSPLAEYLAAVYRQPLSTEELAAVRLDRLQWLWNFAPLQVDCLHVPVADGKLWPLTLRRRVCRSTDQPSDAGAVRVAFNKGLQALDTYGYGVPFPMGRCHTAAEAIVREPVDKAGSVLQGTGGNEQVIEVTRISMEVYSRSKADTAAAKKLNRTRLLAREGGPNGCWFVARRGTGVFLHTGRTLRVQGRAELVGALRINESMLVEAARSRPTTMRRLGKDFLEKMLKEGTAGTYRRRNVEDVIPLCPLARARGYETIVLVGDQSYTYSPEVISCSDECTAEYLDGACSPGLLTGWRASLRCACDSRLPIVNCAKTVGLEAGDTTSTSQPFPNASKGALREWARPYPGRKPERTASYLYVRQCDAAAGGTG